MTGAGSLNGPRRAYRGGTCMHHPVGHWAAVEPDRVAVTREGWALSYGELDDRANRLAARLRSLGVGPDDRVGLCLDRSPLIVVGALGILRAGGAYVPLDAGQPRQRLARMLRETGTRVVVTEPSLAGSLPDCRPVLVEAEANGSETAPRVDGGALPANLAYVIYTSGSTGAPKGVMCTHASCWNYLESRREDSGLGAGDRVLQNFSVTFDPSVWELFGPLAVGGTVVLARPGGHLDPAYLADLIARERVTAFQVVPSVLRLMLEDHGLGGCRDLRHVYCGGETLPPALARLFAAQAPHATLHNIWGATEATIASTDWVCGASDRNGFVAIGRPIANTDLRLVGPDMGLVPSGQSGELVIAGAGVARGYCARPDLTAMAFVPDPAGPPGARCYRTGDQGRLEADGRLAFLGRRDLQVKIRGFRIELGEIEAALAAVPGVSQCTVTTVAEPHREPRLVAYVAGGPSAPDLAGVRSRLRDVLPEYMLPAQLVHLDTLPLTHNGKVDRLRLPAPAAAPEGTAPGEPLRDELEDAVAGVWRELLGVPSVARSDSFLELGGDSLLMSRLAARLAQMRGARPDLRTLFADPTVAGMAAAVGRAAREAGQEIEVVSGESGQPLSFAQEQAWLLQRRRPGQALLHVPAAVGLRGRLDRGALEWALGELVHRHGAIRTVFRSRDGVPVQTIAEPRAVELTEVDARGWTEEERLRLRTEEASSAFDLDAGPPVRWRLLRTGDAGHELLMLLHGLVVDGLSVGVLVRDLAELYASRREGRAARLGALRMRYVDYAAWQRRRLDGETLDRELAHWRRTLGAAPSAVALPSARKRETASIRPGGRETLWVEEDVAARLADLTRAEGATRFMGLVAAFGALLGAVCRQEELVIGTRVANRGRPEFEGVVGPFANTLPLRVDVRGRPTYRELLRRVREVSLGAYEHQEVPVEMLAEPSAGPDAVVRVMLVEPPPAPPVEAGGLVFTCAEIDSGSARYDVNLSAEAVGGRLRLSALYAADLFEPPAVRRLLEQLVTLLAAAVADPDRAVPSP